MKKILYVAPNINVKGGISTVIKGYLSTELSKRHKILLVSSHVDGTKVKKLAQAVLGLCNMFVHLAFTKIDIVHIHGSDIVSSTRKYLYFRLAKFFGPKIIYHFHGALFLDQYMTASATRKRIFRELFETSDLVICLSGSWATSVLSIAPRATTTVVKNAVPMPVLSEPSAAPLGPVRITFLGLIGERKGVFDLIKAVKMIYNNGLNIHLSIAGNGETKKLREEIVKDGLEEIVEFLGWINDRVRDTLLRKTDIFVLPSYGEGMPMSILEAMSYAIPVISTRVGGIPEVVVHEETGYLIEPGDLKDLYVRLVTLVKDESKRRCMGDKGRRTIEANYDLHKTTKIIEHIYDSLCEEKPAGL